MQSFKANDKLYRQVVELSHDGIWVLDEQGITTYVNKAMCDMVGYTPDEMIGVAMLKFLPEEYQLAAADAVEQHMKGNSRRLESQLLHKDGGRVDISVSAVPVIDDNGIITGSFAIITDITQQKNMEQEIKEIDLLRQNEILLSELNRMADLATVSAGLSHEINNPLSFVKSSIGFIQKHVKVFEHFIRYTADVIKQGKSLDDYNDLIEEFRIEDSIAAMNKKIETSNRGIDRILDVVTSLKTFSKRDVAGIEAVDINANIETTLKILIREDYQVNIIKEYGKLPPYLCEPSAINQCLYQLLDNALHAINYKGTIAISTFATFHEEEDVIFIRIEDDGVGMSGETLKKVFVPFFSTRGIGEGKGMGLSMVKGILNRHHGTINIESTEEKGTIITIQLPIMCTLHDRL
ncbi:MAG: PAS domain S-box protein [Candidatus Magnetominusculus sp. LBB02]|nr:PAS domain S-box protein [Candidatus Magnetominusculus sp. LBB02]